MRNRPIRSLGLLAIVVGVSTLQVGCKSPPPFSVSAYRLSPPGACPEPEGIPFYLPKPLLIVSKNFRYVEEPKVGLTDGAPIPNGVDDQSKYADLNARTNFGGLGGTALATTNTGSDSKPSGSTSATASNSTIYAGKDAGPNVVFGGGAPKDGLSPDTFYTYQIVFVPDLSQKYGMKVTGGPGEVRAALNIVNGWQMTGLGPFYLKDSSTAQNRLARGISARLFGQAASDVAKTLLDLRGVPSIETKKLADQSAAMQKQIDDLERMQASEYNVLPAQGRIDAFAEISVYEAFLGPDGQMEWRPIVDRQYSREYMAVLKSTAKGAAPEPKKEGGGIPTETKPMPPIGSGSPLHLPREGGTGTPPKPPSIEISRDAPGTSETVKSVGLPSKSSTADRILAEVLSSTGVTPQKAAQPTTAAPLNQVNVNVPATTKRTVLFPRLFSGESNSNNSGKTTGKGSVREIEVLGAGETPR